MSIPPPATEHLRSAPSDGGNLISYDPAVDASYFDHRFDGYALEGRIIRNAYGDDPWLLSIHGARADYTKADLFTLGLRDRGYSILGMNLSGHNKVSPIPLGETSLADNIAEAEGFYSCLTSGRARKIVAYSLGGTPALKILENHSDEIDRVVLYAPGIYAVDAYPAKFGEQFRRVIREPYSYLRTDVVSILERYRGQLMLVVGEYDGLEPTMYGGQAGGAVGEFTRDGITRYSPIPRDVIDLVHNALPPERRHLIRVPGADHAIVPWMRKHPEQCAELLDRIAEFLRD